MAKTEVQGIDVSFCQTTVDWQKVKAAGIRFVMVRAGFCYNDGSLKVDNLFQKHMKGAADAGLDMGVYLYSYAASGAAAKRAAQETLKLIQPYKLTYPVAFDIEDPSIVKCGRQVLTDTCDAFCAEVERQGYYAMIYANKDWMLNKLDAAKLNRYDLWLAQWASKPTYSGNFGIWQYVGDAGRVDGVKGPCDRNIAYKDYPAIIKKAGLNHLD